VADSGNAGSRVFRFDDLEFDLRALELRRAGAKLRLEGQPLRVLALLLERQGELVSREELRKRLWPGNTIVDFEHSINAAVKRLREALGDSAESPRYIETLPRRGYRFIRPVEPALRPAVGPRWNRRYAFLTGLLGGAGFLAALVVGNAFDLRERWFGAGEDRVAAREAYLLGRAYFAKMPAAGVFKAREYYQKAIAADPAYAPSYAGLAELYAMAGWRLAKEPNGPHFDSHVAARSWAEKALSLDGRLAEAHAALAWVAMKEWDWGTAEARYRRAIELKPDYGVARLWYTMYLYAHERFAEAVIHARRAQQLEPASPMVNTWAGQAYFFAGRFDDAMAAWQTALEIDPKYAHTYVAIVGSYLTRRMPGKAIELLHKALAEDPEEPFYVGALAHAYGLVGRRAEALELLKRLKRRQAAGETLPVFALIWAHAGLGDHDEAFALLEKAYDERRDRMVWLKVDPQLAPLHGDPRFGDLLRRMNIPFKAVVTSAR
jgi:DNA-binding winged helix-turn-helix (wHTH) protein/tetratricopeptide (TPR) repeat protein